MRVAVNRPQWSLMPPPVDLPPFVHLAPEASKMVTAGPFYHRPAFDPSLAREFATWAADQIQAHGIQAIAAQGLSGLVIAGAIGYAARVPVFAVRKPSESGHSSDVVSGIAPDGPVDRWAFVDDLIETGRTLHRTRNAIRAQGLVTTAVPSLILLYGDFNQSTVRVLDGTEVPQLLFRK